MDFNVRLKNIRKRNGATQKAVSDHLGITLRTYQRYEDGSIEPPLSTVILIANYFNLPMDCLSGNGLFSNWDEILSHKEEITSFLRDSVPFLSHYDLSSLTESQLACILPSIFAKITFSGPEINLFPLIPLDGFPSPTAVRADGH